MVEDRVPAQTRTQALSAHWRGHAFLFDTKRLPAYNASAGFCLLLIFVALEGILGPRLWLFHWIGLPLPPTWIRVPILLGVSLLLVRFVAGEPVRSGPRVRTLPPAHILRRPGPGGAGSVPRTGCPSGPRSAWAGRSSR